MTSLEEERQALAKLEDEWMEAMQRRDAERLEELVAPEFRFTAIHLSPEPMTREAWIGAALGGYHISSYYFDEMEIDIAGDTAVVHANYSQIASFDGRNLSHMFRLTDVWARRDGRWQVVVRHSSIIA